MENIVIRRAVREDCPRLLELVHELAEYEKAPQEVTVKLDHFTESGFGAQPVWWAFVVTVNGRLEGFALYYIRYSTWKGQRLYLEDLIVTEEFRGKGIGKLLFDSTVEEAQKLQVGGMMWQVLDWNQPAIEFYKKYGADVSGEWLNCSLTLNA